MDSGSDFNLMWGVYLLAASGFFAVYWPLTRFPRALWLSYVLRGLMLALVLTPWYANSQDTVMAPALMVIMLDAITIGPQSAARAVVPLALSLITALIGATILYFARRGKIRKKH